MSITDRVQSREVTLGQPAHAAAEHFGVPEPDVRMARAICTSAHETARYLEVITTLPDGRRAKLFCAPEQPAHVIDLRLL